MDELAKTEARNYLSAAGFFLIAAGFLLTFLTNIGSGTLVETNYLIHLAIGIGLLIIATLLIVLRKRDMIAILFFMLGFFQLFCAFASPGDWTFILVGFLVLVALVTLTSKEKVKWLLFLIPAIMFVERLERMCVGYNSTVFMVFYLILAIISLYYAFCCACERCHLPGSKLLIADETTDFKASGSVLGYMLFALVTAGWIIYNFASGFVVLPFENLQTIEILCSILMIFVAVLLMVVGKMRFTPVMFLLIGLSVILGIYSTGYMLIGIGIIFLVIGLFAMLRKESRILPGIMLIISSIVYFILGATGDFAPSYFIGVLKILSVAIAIYLSFVVYSQRKLPKF